MTMGVSPVLDKGYLGVAVVEVLRISVSLVFEFDQRYADRSGLEH